MNIWNQMDMSERKPATAQDAQRWSKEFRDSTTVPAAATEAICNPDADYSRSTSSESPGCSSSKASGVLELVVVQKDGGPQPKRPQNARLTHWMSENKFAGANEKKKCGFLGFSFTYPLHRAVEQEQFEIAEELLLSDANPHSKNSSGRTVLDVANRKKNRRLIMLIKDFNGKA